MIVSLDWNDDGFCSKDEIPNNVALVMERLKKAFSANVGDGVDPVVATELLTCDGPGVMLMELASRYDAAKLQVETNVFQCVEESIEECGIPKTLL